MQNQNQLDSIIKRVLIFLIYYVVFQVLITKYLFTESIVYKYLPELVTYVLFFSLLIKKQKLKLIKHDKILIYLGIYIVLSSAFINHIQVNIIFLVMRTLYRYIILYLLIINLEISKKDVILFIKHIKIAGGIVLFFGTLQILFPQILSPILTPDTSALTNNMADSAIINDGKAIFSLFERYDRYGIFLSIIIMIYFYIGNRKDKLISLLAIVNIVYSYSRQSWLGLLIALYMGLFIKKKISKAFFINGLIVLAILVVLTIQVEIKDVYFGTPLERVLQVFSSSYIHTNMESARLRIFFDVLPDFLSKLNIYTFFGLGFGSFSMLANNLTNNMLFMRYFELFNVPFSGVYHIGDVFWIEMLMEIGIVGLVMLFMYFVKAFRYFLENSRNNPDEFSMNLNYVTMGLIIICLITDFFGPNLLITSFSFFFWLVLALTTKLNSINNQIEIIESKGD